MWVPPAGAGWWAAQAMLPEVSITGYPHLNNGKVKLCIEFYMPEHDKHCSQDLMYALKGRTRKLTGTTRYTGVPPPSNCCCRSA